jgi:cation diffusion facilitator CzcD-associated flavoprotein CzcO
MTTAADPDFQATEALRYLGPDPDNWVPARPGLDHNVLVVGGGHTGSTFAFALRRAGIGGISIIDAAANEAQSGIWLTRARMQKLRTPKNLQGPELGQFGLSFQAWYEARHGREAYEAIDRIPRIDWADYLVWYRKILQIPIRYGTRLLRIEPADDRFRVHLSVNGNVRIETARKIILGTGVASAGGPFIPDVIAQLPREYWSHTADAIDFGAFKGQTIAVVGSAASAFDAAAVALEHGAASVHLFSRRSSLAALPVGRLKGYPGAYDNYPHLPDAIRWSQARRFRLAGSTPPPDAVARAVGFPNFHLHLGAPWQEALEFDGRIETRIDGERFAFDHVIAGTGYFVDPRVRPEFEGFADKIRLWADQYQPALGDEDPALATHPYLGSGHEFLEKTPDTAPFLKNIHVYNPSGFVSFGLPIGDVPSLKRDVPAVVARISRDLFLEDLDAHETRLNGSIAPEFAEDAYSSAIWHADHREAAE